MNLILTVLIKPLPDSLCDKHRFKKLYETYAQQLSDIMYYKYGDGLQAVDHVQDAFVTLWQHCKEVTPATAKAYVYKVANNKLLNAVKHRKVKLRYQKVVSEDYVYETPEFVLRKKQFLEQYEQVLSSLKPEQREAFMLSKIEGKTHQEIADMLGVTKKVVEHRIYAAFGILRDRLEEFH